MQLTTLTIAAALLVRAFAQTPANFPVTVQTNLGAIFESSNVTVFPPGVLIPRPETAVMPTLYVGSNVSSTGLYIAFMIDSDVPRNNSLTTLLHWFQPNLLPSPGVLVDTPSAVNASTAVGATYLQPSPPPGSGAHEYTLLLFTQPEGFTVPTSYLSINPPADSSARIGFNISAFIAASGLAQPISANYFRVLNGTAAETSSIASTIARATASTAMSSTASSTPASTAASTTLTGSASPTAAASATATTSTGAAADVRGSGREVVAGFAMAVVGAAMWMA